MLERFSRSAARAAGMLVPGLVAALLSGCGTVDTESFQPVAPRSLEVAGAAGGVEARLEQLLSLPGDEAGREEARRIAEEIEAILLGPAYADRPDLVQPLRLAALQYAAEFPERREENGRRIAAAAAVLPPPAIP